MLKNLKRIEENAKEAALNAKYGAYHPVKELEWTAVPLVAFGLIAKGSKKDFRQARNNFIPSYKNRADDYLQHLPLALSVGLKLGGYKGRNDFWRFLASGGMSYGIMALLTNGIKYTAKEMRPDGSTANSFPSGHTATAFVAATILHKEYGLTRSPWWSVLGYACATTTGIMRTLNNRHWISDVLVGAGIGVVSTDLAYMIADYIFKKKGTVLEPRKGDNDMWQHPSFFKLSLGMQFINNLKMPTQTTFTTMQQAWSEPYADLLNDEYYTVVRNGNPFRIPDNYKVADGERTFKNYAGEGQGGSQIYNDPTVKIGVGTTVAAEGAYFINKYVGVGVRGRITTAPAYVNGLSCYNSEMKLLPSNSITDTWSLVDINAGVYGAWPITPRHNVGAKVMYGRRFYGALDMQAAYDVNYQNVNTGEVANAVMYGDNLYISRTNSDDLAVGLSYTYSLNNGVAVSAFADYDFSKPTFDVEYTPYHVDTYKMAKTASNFSFKQKINSFTIGASMTVLF
ncbi:MAG: phosphatase PAP2 family protein [Prevotella sp.]|nr:phosphatase PAP2 family protein [Candidatus Prevotella equi]